MPAPTIYNYHPQTGELLGSGYADPDPLTENAWLMPAHSTQQTPPSTPDGTVAVWHVGAWAVHADHRGETWWKDGGAFVIDFLGNPADHGYSTDGPPAVGANQAVVWENGAWSVKVDHRSETWWSDHDTPVLIETFGDPAEQGLVPDRPPALSDEVPEPEPEWGPATLAEAIEYKLAELDNYRWEREVGGTLFNGVMVRTDSNSASKIDGAIALFDKDPECAVVEFEVQPGIWIDLDQATMTALGVAVGRHIQHTFSRKRQLQAEIAALTTIAEVMDYNLGAHW